MNKLLFLILTTLIYSTSQAQDVTVFESGKDNHNTFRIPAIIQLPNQDILAFAEGRVDQGGDYGDINIVMKRSSDKGQTWSEMQMVVDYDTLQAGNPAPVVDLTDPQYPKGRIFLFYNTGNHHEYNVRMKQGYREVWYVSSIDNGKTWSVPVNITAQTHKINQPKVHSTYNHKEDWRTYANTPGHAVQFDKGKYKGRIYVAANHSEGNAKNDFTDYVAHGFYSDDHGKTFKISENISIWGSNESIAVPISRDRLVMNSRNQKGDIRQRITSVSYDGGHSWATSYFDTNLPDPVNQGSIIGLGSKKGNKWIAFSNAADTQKRDNLTLRISNDEGKSWFKNIPIAKAPENYPNGQDYTAYSDLVKMNKNTIGVLYEKDHYSTIVFRAIKWQ